MQIIRLLGLKCKLINDLRSAFNHDFSFLAIILDRLLRHHDQNCTSETHFDWLKLLV